MIHPQVSALLERCPFLRTHLDCQNLDLPTVAFGAAARAVISHVLKAEEERAVFAYFSELAERGDADEIVGTGALELFNDSAAAQKLARGNLTGRALILLEDLRGFWGQPDYSRST